ncbi:MAG TPA: dihydrolipoamide acetyltransferase family protein [Ktedonobacterales bacterium]|nr:dihydrolipoamide acetyltransferase family protein [Ktedonobacterales bacterium]
MAINVIMPALGMAQETGILVQWLKREGEAVAKGEPIAEIETDKARVEIEAPGAGVLANVTAGPGAEVPVGQTMALILAPGEALPTTAGKNGAVSAANADAAAAPRSLPDVSRETSRPGRSAASPLAARMAAEHQLDVSAIKPTGKRVQKADVQSYLQQQRAENHVSSGARLTPASPKARRLAAEQGADVAAIQGTGPGGAVLAGDVLAAMQHSPAALGAAFAPAAAGAGAPDGLAMSNVWRIMAERTTQSWTSAPHFFLLREVNASRLMAWRERLVKRSAPDATYTDLLVKLVAAALRAHPRLNAAWSNGKISLNQEINIGLAAATEDGLVVPVIHGADTLTTSEIAARRKELVARAQAGKLRPEDVRGGTFTISNLGMYGMDAFTAIINAPQVAILAVGRIAERVVPVEGQPGVQPMLVLSLSCDHRAVDGARGAQFLAALAEVIEEPLGLLT